MKPVEGIAMQPVVANIDNIPPVRCPCGWARRAFTDVSGAPARAALMKFVTTRPSSGRILGPYVLKIRAMRTSSPWRRW